MNFDVSDQKLTELNSKGYCKIENFLNKDHLKYLLDSWESIKNQAIKDEIYAWSKKDENYHTHSDIYKKDGKWNLWKSHYILIRTEIGNQYINAITSLMHRINPDLVYMKDRIMNQEPNTKGHRPHQDTSSGDYGFFEKYTTGELYTVYISLTDTNQNNGCLWVEEIKKRRDTRLGYCDQGCAGGNPCLCTNWEHTADAIKFYNGHIMKPLTQSKGDAIIFDGYALHGTGKNITDDTRKTILIMYAVPKKEYKNLDEPFWKFTSSKK